MSNFENNDFIYRKELSIPNNIRFGVEIEFVGALYKTVKECIKSFNSIDLTQYCKLPSYLGLFEDYNKWRCVNDGSVQYDDSLKNMCGGEVTSPILYNSIDCFNSLKNVCCILKSIPNIGVDDRCGLHIHVDRNIYGQDAKTFIRLLKLWMLFEDVIYRFAYGTDFKERLLIHSHALPINKRVYDDLYLLSLYEKGSFNGVIADFKGKNQGLSFFYTKDCFEAILNTIEVRVFNGTLDEVIIQNDINFIINFLLYAVDGKFDDELIDYMVKRFKPMEISEFTHVDLEKAQLLSDLIFSNEIDKLYFIRQYLKCFTVSDLIDKQKVL